MWLSFEIILQILDLVILDCCFFFLYVKELRIHKDYFPSTFYAPNSVTMLAFPGTFLII